MISNQIKFKTIDSAIELGRQSKFSSVNKQKRRLTERRKTKRYFIRKNSLNLVIDKGVYKTGVDTELMIEVLSKAKGISFIEIGCGTGAISISLSRRFNYGVAVDINKAAIINTLENCVLNKVKNIEVIQSDVFKNINGKFDLIICNPPYNNKTAKDDIEKMFWDSNNEMKSSFFNNLNKYLKIEGKVYFGWADISDIDIQYPIREANKIGLRLVKIYSRFSNCNSFRFLVYEFVKK